MWWPDHFSIDQPSWLFPKQELVKLGLALDTLATVIAATASEKSISRDSPTVVGPIS
jgi:hypothetical protein